MNLLNPIYLIQTTGYIGLFLAVLFESGFVFGFFLPGDSLLFTAGILASQHFLNIFLIILLSIVAAIVGNNLGYFTGKKLGHRLFTRHESFLFSPRRVEQAHEFFDTHGPKSLILARFIPAVRTFVPIIGGTAKMDYRRFLTFNAIGGLLWGVLLPVLGFTLGKSVPNIDHYLLPIILLIIVISVLPILVQYLKAKKTK